MGPRGLIGEGQQPLACWCIHCIELGREHWCRCGAWLWGMHLSALQRHFAASLLVASLPCMPAVRVAPAARLQHEPRQYASKPQMAFTGGKEELQLTHYSGFICITLPATIARQLAPTRNQRTSTAGEFWRGCSADLYRLKWEPVRREAPWVVW